jgi:hypothetical protein
MGIPPEIGEAIIGGFYPIATGMIFRPVRKRGHGAAQTRGAANPAVRSQDPFPRGKIFTAATLQRDQNMRKTAPAGIAMMGKSHIIHQ